MIKEITAICEKPVAKLAGFRNSLISVFLFGIGFFAAADSGYFSTPGLLIPYLTESPQINSMAGVVIDSHTGALLYSKNPDLQIPPASLTKLMTMHLLLNEVKAGGTSLNAIVPITEESWALRQPPRSSLMFLEPGQIVTLREILLGLAVSSGNDAAVAAALYLAPNVNEFTRLMTMQARNMGLAVTRFTDTSGYSSNNITTAAEFTHFCRQYINLHPESLNNFHSVPVFAYPAANNAVAAKRNNPGTIVQHNSNTLLETFPGVDGLKTGFIRESGYNFALTAQRNDTRFIAVTLGADSSRNRRRDADMLLSWAFNNFKTVRPAAIVIDPQRLWKGRDNYIELVLKGDADFTSPVSRANNLMQKIEISSLLTAPLPAGYRAGDLVFYDDYGELNRIPLVTIRDYEKGNIFKRLWHSIILLFKQ